MARFPNNSFGLGASPWALDYERLNTSVTTRFFNMVYMWMAAGLAMTAVIAFWVANTPELLHWATSRPALIAAFIVELGLVVTISGAVNRISTTTAILMFMLYSAINGWMLSVLFLMYTRSSVAGTFFVTAGAFGAMSLYGYVTKRDLTRLGSLLFMALIGLVLASVVNLFWANSGLYWIITYAGVLIFVGLTAFDTQRLKGVAVQTQNDPRLASRLAIVGSLVLYLDFINLFILLLRLMGNRQND